MGRVFPYSAGYMPIKETPIINPVVRVTLEALISRTITFHILSSKRQSHVFMCRGAGQAVADAEEHIAELGAQLKDRNQELEYAKEDFANERENLENYYRDQELELEDKEEDIAKLGVQLEDRAQELAALEGRLQESLTDEDAAKGKLKAERENAAVLEAARAAAVKVRPLRDICLWSSDACDGASSSACALDRCTSQHLSSVAFFTIVSSKSIKTHVAD